MIPTHQCGQNDNDGDDIPELIPSVEGVGRRKLVPGNFSFSPLSVDVCLSSRN